MDKIQDFLIKKGRSDLADEYYKKYTAAKKKKEEISGPSYIKILSMIRNLKTEKQFADFKSKIKDELKKTWGALSADQKKILNRELEKKETLYKKKKDKK